MECPTCGYDNMDAVADDGRIIYSCPVCDVDEELSKYAHNTVRTMAESLDAEIMSDECEEGTNGTHRNQIT